MQFNPLDDNAALTECRRILFIISARRRVENKWFGQESEPSDIPLNEDSAFVSGMLAMFRYARGEDVPPAIVQDFRDVLLNLMFTGLASGALALPSFRRMADRSWAIAWRLAEIRLALEGHETTDVSQLAHLLGVTQNVLAQQLIARGYDPNAPIPAAFLQDLYAELNKSQEQTVKAVMIQP